YIIYVLNLKVLEEPHNWKACHKLGVLQADWMLPGGLVIRGMCARYCSLSHV
ncbi:unnamed protein product, partial [Candidula unifasciata]